MSKSRGNVINPRRPPPTRPRARSGGRGQTPSWRITLEPERRPEVANLLTLAGRSPARTRPISQTGSGTGGGRVLKQVVTEAVNETLAGHRARRVELARDPSHVTAVLHEGNARANAIAERTLATVRAVMGMAY